MSARAQTIVRTVGVAAAIAYALDEFDLGPGLPHPANVMLVSALCGIVCASLIITYGAALGRPLAVGASIGAVVLASALVAGSQGMATSLLIAAALRAGGDNDLLLT